MINFKLTIVSRVAVLETKDLEQLKRTVSEFFASGADYKPRTNEELQADVLEVAAHYEIEATPEDAAAMCEGQGS